MSSSCLQLVLERMKVLRTDSCVVSTRLGIVNAW